MRKTLGSFLEETSEKTTENDQYPVLTSSKAGLFFQSDYFNKQVASKNNVGYKIIHRGEFTYRAMSDTGKFFPNMLECADIGIVSPAYPVFRISRQGLVEPDYLKYFFRSDNFQYSISRFAQGSTRTSIRFAQMKTVFINLPNLNEQKAVVSVLKEAEKAIKLRQQELDKFDELIKARFVEMFAGKDYPTQKLRDVCSKITDGTHKTPHYLEEGITFISAKNVINGKLNFDDVKHISEDEYEEIQRRCNTEYGDVLLTKSGTLGLATVVDTEEKIGLFESLAVIKYFRNKLDGLFLCEQLKSSRVQSQLQDGVKGVAVKHLHLNVIGDVDIIVPPLEKQQTFSQFIHQVDKSKSVVKKSLDETQLLFDSLMQKYFG